MALKGWYELFKLCLLLLVLVCQRQAVRGQTDFQPDGTPEPASTVRLEIYFTSILRHFVHLLERCFAIDCNKYVLTTESYYVWV